MGRKVKIFLTNTDGATVIELDDGLTTVLERIANPLIRMSDHDMGPLVDLGNEKPVLIRPGWVAQVQKKNEMLTTLTTVRGFVIVVDQDYKSVQGALGGRPKPKVPHDDVTSWKNP